MDGIKQQVYARQQEAVENKHMYEVRKRNRELRNQLTKLKDKNQSTLTRITKDYNKAELDEQNKLEMKLTQLRKKNKLAIKTEDERFKTMVGEIHLSHDGKIEELKNSQEKEVESRTVEHQEYLETARAKFQSDKMKLEA